MVCVEVVKLHFADKVLFEGAVGQRVFGGWW